MKTRTICSPALALIFTAGLLASCADHPFTPSDEEAPVLSKKSSQGAASPVTMQDAGLLWFADMSDVADATASLLRNPSGLRFRIHTGDLPPGDAVTIWWVVFNFPEHCTHPVADLMACSEPDLFDEDVAATVLFGAGNVIGGSGKGNFAGALKGGDLKGCQPPFGDFGLCRGGLVNPAGAEVHLVVRTHGPKLPGMVSEQIKTFAGGCTPETSFGAGTGPNACEDLQFSIITAP